MEEQLRQEILQKMRDEFSDEQINKLEAVLDIVLYKYKIEQDCHEIIIRDNTNDRLLQRFLSTKLVEGKSKKTVCRYRLILKIMIDYFGKSVKEINTDDLRYYLARYQQDRNVCNNTLDGMRRIFSSFFTWLNDEGHINRNPARMLKQIKVEREIGRASCRERVLTSV